METIIIQIDSEIPFPPSKKRKGIEVFRDYLVLKINCYHEVPLICLAT